jgi:uncharacterized protein YcnI
MNNRTESKITAVKIFFLILILSGLSRGVAAHASLEQETAESGAGYRGVLRISHGCNGSPTVAVRIRIPDGVRGTKPMPKPGWQLETVVTKLDEPYNSHGSTITEDVSELIWKGGSLSDDFFDEFVFRTTLPETAVEKTLYFRTVQECENGQFLRWIEIPEPDKAAGDYREPAPALKLVPSGKGGL